MYTSRDHCRGRVPIPQSADASKNHAILRQKYRLKSEGHQAAPDAFPGERPSDVVYPCPVSTRVVETAPIDFVENRRG
jgi:hypothetical protein